MDLLFLSGEGFSVSVSGFFVSSNFSFLSGNRIPLLISFTALPTLLNNRNENNTFELSLQAFVNVVRFEKTIVRIAVKINADVFLKCGSDFLFEVSYKLCYPIIVLVILMSIRDKDVVFEAGYN